MSKKSLAYSVISGLIYALAFPKFNLWWCAFLWPLPFYFSISKAANWRKAFGLGWLAGFAAFLIILYWVAIAISAAGGNVLVAVLGWALLAGYIAFFFGLFAVFAQVPLRLSHRRKPVSSEDKPKEGLDSGFRRNDGEGAPEQSHKLISPFLLASLWVSAEFARSKFLGGFPWCLLGYSLSNSLALMQWAEWGGIWILSAIPMLISGYLWVFLSFPSPLKGENRVRGPFYLASSILLAGFFVFAGHSRMKYLEKMLVPGLKIAVLQGNFAQYEKWDENRAQAIVDVYQNLIRQAHAKAPDLVVWPEAAWPYLQGLGTGREGSGKKQIEKFLKQEEVSHLVGVVFADKNTLFNSALLVNKGKITGRYDKAHLVPFGEFVPMGWLLAPWIDVLNQVGGISPGPAHIPLELPGGKKMGVTICYEAIFPEISRQLARQGAFLLVNLTNDGWYLDTAAPYQHFQMNLVRAVENRLPLLRSANTGISAFITPLGAIEHSTRLDEAGLAYRPIMTLDASGLSAVRRYAVQNVFLAGCLVLALFAMMKLFQEYIRGLP